MLHPRRRLDFKCTNDSAGGGLGAIPTPVSIPDSLGEAPSIAQSAGGVKSLIHSPWLSRPGLRPPVKITTTNPHFDRAIISVGHRGEGKFSARAREGAG